MPSQTFRSRDTSAAKSISGPMLLAAHWAKTAEDSLRIQVTVVNKDLPLRPSLNGSGYKRRK